MKMEEFERFAMVTDPLLSCSECRHLLQESVLLKCLHNCCRQCFNAAAMKDGCRDGVRCSSCSVVTQVGSEQSNGFVDCLVQRYKRIAESRMCDKCKENDEQDKPALVWCRSCRLSLCDDCMSAHSQFNRQHVTQSLDKLDSLDEVCSQPTAAACGIHGKPLDVLCLNCEEAKCISCWASCKAKKHKVHIVCEESFDSYVGSLISGISSIESEILKKSAVLSNPMIFLLDAKAARDRHLEDLKKRKRRVVDAVEEAYEKIVLITKDAYDDMEAEGVAAAETAQRIASDLSDTQSYIRRLVDSNEKCEMFKQHKMLRQRLNVLSAELDSLSGRLASTARKVMIEASLPPNLDEVVGAWLGLHRTCSAPASIPAPSQQQQQSYSFGAASASFMLPVQCWNVALTKDGRSLLLAAAKHGLLELSSSSKDELSRWRPPKRRCGRQEDWVMAVSALSDGRAAVSVHFAQLVVLLRRCEFGSSSGGAAATAAASSSAAAGGVVWIEDRRLDALPWPVRFLSAHGDVLAASEYRLDKKTDIWLPGPRLQLMSLSSGQRLTAEHQVEYDILSLVVAANRIVTGSLDKVKLGGGRRASHVLDAHGVTDEGSEVRLWRHVLNSSSDREEEQEEWLLAGICLESSGGCLYAAARRSDMRSGRVSALSLADGSELLRVALSFSSAAAQPQLLPMQLSLCEDGAASGTAAERPQLSRGCRVLLLAALCWDATTEECRTVTLHRSTCDVLQ